MNQALVNPGSFCTGRWPASTEQESSKINKEVTSESDSTLPSPTVPDWSTLTGGLQSLWNLMDKTILKGTLPEPTSRTEMGEGH